MKIRLVRNKKALFNIALLFIIVPIIAYQVGLKIYPFPHPSIMGIQDKIIDTHPTLPNITGIKTTVTVNPGSSITTALAKAKPGTRIIVKAGTYPEHIITHRSGSSSLPIILQAKGKVILTGDDSNGRIFELKHDYYVIDGFEMKGRDTALWLEEADHNIIKNNYFHHLDGECVRLKYQSSNNLITNNRVENCGLDDFMHDGGGKNGEGIYIGTAPEQLSRNPSPEPDNSHTNLVRNNTFITNGNECVDIKEGSSRNIVEFNSCTGQKDTESAGLDSRGNENVFRYNYIFNNRGAGIRFGGDTKADGIYNQAYGNKIEGNKNVAFKIQRQPQSIICGNRERNNQKLSNNKHTTNPPCSFTLKAPGPQTK